jgi:multiple sugar transport system substrate-binding protein
MTTQMSIGLGALAVVLIGAAWMGEKAVVRQDRTDRVTVIYWEKWTGAEGIEMRKVVDAFNRSQDKIFVKYLSISGVDNKTRLATAGGNPPDIAGIWGDQICQFADANAMTDLTELAKESGLTADYYIPAYWDAYVFHDRLWALPSTPASIGLHVRPDLVPADVATPETFPKTLEGLDALVEKISTKNPNGSLKFAGFLPSNPGWWHWSWGYFFGGKLVDGDRLTINCPENVRAFEWIAKYTKKFGSKEVQNFQGGFGNFASPQDPFMTGKVATEINGVWKANYINVSKPGLKWFAVPFPHPADRPDLAGRSNLSQDVLCIPRGAKHVKEAFEFIRYVQRQDVMEGLCSAHGKNSPLAKVSEKFMNTHPNKFIRLFDQLARSPQAFGPPKIGIYPQIGTEMGVAFSEVNSEQKSPKQALDDAQARLETIWKTYKAQVLNEQ